MKTIQVVLGTKLLKATNLTAKRQKTNRSALVRYASQKHLEHLRGLELEEQDRQDYLKYPQSKEEDRIWEDIEAWPKG